jgi:uncharacterized protein
MSKSKNSWGGLMWAAFAVWTLAVWAEKIPEPKQNIEPPTPLWTAEIEKLAPAKPTVAAPVRKVLVFSLFTGFDHKVIPHVDRVFETLAKKSGAMTVEVTRDIERLDADKLAAFDVLVLNNNCSVGPRRNLFLDVLEKDEKYRDLSTDERKSRAAELERSILAFVSGGKGLVAIHGAPTMLNNSAEFTKMIGGSFDYHPANQYVTLEVVDENHPLTAAFRGQGPFVPPDEPYCFKGAHEKPDFRPLLKMDGGKIKAPPGRLREMVRYAAWIKRYGSGRVFYCSPSHFPESYQSAAMLQFLLDGLQYAAGDLKCDDK